MPIVEAVRWRVKGRAIHQIWLIKMEGVEIARMSRAAPNRWSGKITDWHYNWDLDRKFYAKPVRAAINELAKIVDAANLHNGDHFEVEVSS